MPFSSSSRLIVAEGKGGGQAKYRVIVALMHYRWDPWDKAPRVEEVEVEVEVFDDDSLSINVGMGK